MILYITVSIFFCYLEKEFQILPEFSLLLNRLIVRQGDQKFLARIQISKLKVFYVKESWQSHMHSTICHQNGKLTLDLIATLSITCTK